MSTIKKFLIKIYEAKCVDINTRVEPLEAHCVQYKLNIRDYMLQKRSFKKKVNTPFQTSIYFALISEHTFSNKNLFRINFRR